MIFFFNQELSNNTLATNLGFHLPLMIPRPSMYKEDAFQFTVGNLIPSGRSRLEISSMGGSLCLVTSLPHRRAGLQLPKLQSIKRIPYPLIWWLPRATTQTPSPPPLVASDICLLGASLRLPGAGSHACLLCPDPSITSSKLRLESLQF